MYNLLRSAISNPNETARVTFQPKQIGFAAFKVRPLRETEAQAFKARLQRDKSIQLQLVLQQLHGLEEVVGADRCALYDEITFIAIPGKPYMKSAGEIAIIRRLNLQTCI